MFTQLIIIRPFFIKNLMSKFKLIHHSYVEKRHLHMNRQQDLKGRADDLQGFFVRTLCHIRKHVLDNLPGLYVRDRDRLIASFDELARQLKLLFEMYENYLYLICI
jgi:hypothetical protein